jgi:hypothetical protein
MKFPIHDNHSSETIRAAPSPPQQEQRRGAYGPVTDDGYDDLPQGDDSPYQDRGDHFPSPYDMEQPARAGGVHYQAARGFGQIIGVHPAIVFLTFIVDTMLFGGEAVSLGASLPFSLAAAAVLGYIAYKAQMKFYGDDDESAKIKALILAFLTAIPTPLPALVYIPAGVVGFFHGLRRKEG